jgi:DnaK suppressor protein
VASGRTPGASRKHAVNARNLWETAGITRPAGRACRAGVIFPHRSAIRVRHNSVIVGDRVGGYKLAPRARGFAVFDGVAMSPHKNGVAVLDKNKLYRPSDKEPFMNERQREYFRQKLLDWKEEILKEAKETLAHLQAENENHPDLADRASSETDRAIELRARDRQRKLIAKIDAALTRLDDGTYGYCEETGEPIALKRLEARPIATLSVEAQERHERRERIYRDE